MSVFDIEWGKKPSTREGVSKSKPEGKLKKQGLKINTSLYILFPQYLILKISFNKCNFKVSMNVLQD